MKGKILSVNISDKKGEKKNCVESVFLVEDFGVKDDAHGGAEIRQVSLLSKASMDKIREKGLAVVAGDFAENLTIEGIDLPSLPVGTMMKIGESVLVRVSQIGKECHSRCNIFYTVGDCVMPREGIFVQVIKGGEVKAGDDMEVLP